MKKFIPLIFSGTLLLQLSTSQVFAWGTMNSTASQTMPAAGGVNSTTNNRENKLYTCSASKNDTAASETIAGIKAEVESYQKWDVKPDTDKLAGIILDKNVSLPVKNEAAAAFTEVCKPYGHLQEGASALYQICTNREIQDSFKISLLKPLSYALYDSLQQGVDPSAADRAQSTQLLASFLAPVNSDNEYRLLIEEQLSDIGYLNKDNRDLWQEHNILVYQNGQDGEEEISAIRDAIELFPDALLPKEGMIFFLSDSSALNVGGTYSSGAITMNSDQMKVKNGRLYYERAVTHEIGHHIYQNLLTDAQRENWDGLFKQSFKEGFLDQSASVIPPKALTKDASEDFAYTLGDYMSNGLELLRRAAGDSKTKDVTAEYNSPLIDKIYFVEGLFSHAGTGASFNAGAVSTYAYRPDYKNNKIERYEIETTKLNMNGLISEELGLTTKKWF